MNTYKHLFWISQACEKITIFYRVNWKMQWLFLSEGTNQLFSLILKLKQMKMCEKSSEKRDFQVKRENHFFHEIFQKSWRLQKLQQNS